jgi:hypothetical protein
LSKHLMVMSSFVYLNAGSLENILCALWVLVEKEKKNMPFLAFEKWVVTGCMKI